MEKISSLILSLAMHCILFFIIVFWPASVVVNLEQESYKVSLVMADMGGINLASSVLGAPAPNINDQVNPSLESHVVEEEVTEIQAIELEELEEAEEVPQTPESLPENEPEIPKEALLPLPPQERLKELEEEAKKLAEAEAKAKAEAEAKAKAEAEAKAKAEAEAKAKAEAEAEAKAKAEAEEKKKAEEKALAEAKAKKEAEEKAKKAAAAKAAADKKKNSAASSLLADLAKQKGIGGGAGEGSGAGGGGIYDVYVGQVMLIVQQSWSIPIYSREVYSASIKVLLDVHGKIVNTEVLRSSGRADFDASALNALSRLGSLPPPPNKELQELELEFSSAQ